MTEYKVVSGDLLLGRTSSYNEAIEWMRRHNQIKVNGPYARIVEVNSDE